VALQEPIELTRNSSAELIFLDLRLWAALKFLAGVRLVCHMRYLPGSVRLASTVWNKSSPHSQRGKSVRRGWDSGLSGLLLYLGEILGTQRRS
jgi:hypothetical protein